MRSSFKRGYKDMHANIYIYWGIDNISDPSTAFSNSRGAAEYDPLFEVEFLKGTTLHDICDLCNNLQSAEHIKLP